jgi:hypothetical protein
MPVHHGDGHHGETFCMITMADATARAKYDLSLRSQVCYARRHGYEVAVVDIKLFSKEDTMKYMKHLPITFRKHDVLEQWAADDRCDWLVWFDGDQFIVDYERPLTAFIPGPHHGKNVSVIMKDDPNIINNGAFMLRNTPWLRTKMLPLWRELDFNSKHPGYPFTDNGSMLELLCRLFVPGYRPNECGAPGNMPPSFTQCINRRLYRELGETCLRPKDCSLHPGRGANGLFLLEPKKAFNHHGCPYNGEFSFLSCAKYPGYWSGIGKELYYLDNKPLNDRFLDAMVSSPAASS